MPPDELVELGKEIVRQAGSRGIEVRLMGGVAVYSLCPSIESHPKLQRPYNDLDLVASPGTWDTVRELLTSLGFETANVHSDRAAFKREGLTVDVRGTHYSDFFSFDFSSRLSLDPITLPPVDLLLLKLQRFSFAPKDIQDATALLLDHRVADNGDDEAIDRVYLYNMANRNWGLWTTLFDNTVTLEKVLDKYIDPEEAQLVWRRIELIQEVLDGKSKSIGWWLRSVPNRHIKWYREPSG